MSEEILKKVQSAFKSVIRPEHFTDPAHCCECAEHDETLRSHDPESISIEQLGNPGWDPICFVTLEGFIYYCPALARLALDTENYYLDQFLFHLNEERIAGFSEVQRAAIHGLLVYIQESFRDKLGEEQHWGFDYDLPELEKKIEELGNYTEK